MPRQALPDWALVRHRYEETDDRVADICAAAGITETALANRRRREGWIRKLPRPFPGRVPRPPSRASGMKRGPAATRGTSTRTASARARTRTPTRPPKAATASPPPGPAAPPRSARPSSPATRRLLLGRLVAAISLKLEQLERRMTEDLATPGRTARSRKTAAGRSSTATDHERETRAIGALIDNLGKITEIETGIESRTRGRTAAAAHELADEADRRRRELAERLERLVRAAAGKP